MSEPVQKCVEVEKLRGWRMQLSRIQSPSVPYSDNALEMAQAAIQQSQRIASVLLEEIESELGAHL